MAASAVTGGFHSEESEFERTAVILWCRGSFLFSPVLVVVVFGIIQKKGEI